MWKPLSIQNLIVLIEVRGLYDACGLIIRPWVNMKVGGLMINIWRLGFDNEVMGQYEVGILVLRTNFTN